MNCFYCKGEYELAYEPFTAKLENGIVVINDVPTKVCAKCGQSVYSNDVAEKIEQITNKMRGKIKEIALVQYAESNVA